MSGAMGPTQLVKERRDCVRPMEQREGLCSMIRRGFRPASHESYGSHQSQACPIPACALPPLGQSSHPSHRSQSSPIPAVHDSTQ